MKLSVTEKERYKKHLQLAQIGESGQNKLKDAAVVVVGAGGLGSPVLAYLAAAGVGNISIIDPDRVTLSNLQRQVIHDTPALDRLKVDSAAERIQRLNPEIRIETHAEYLVSVNAAAHINGKSVVVDCTDNLETRLVINETCVSLGIPFVYGAVFEFEGHLSVFATRDGPCLRCMLPEIPKPETIPNPQQHGLLATVPGLLGVLQAGEVIKLLLGIGEPLIGRLLVVDILAPSFLTLKINKRKDCPVCGRTG